MSDTIETDETPIARVRPSMPGLRLEQNSVAAKRRAFFLTAPLDADRDDVRVPDFWRNFAGQLRVEDVIYLRGHDWEMELRVDALNPVEFSVARQFGRKPLGANAENLSDRDFLEFRGPDGWCVMRRARTAGEAASVYKRGFASAAAARISWAAEQPRAA